jgi:hypothetical protein
MQRYWPIALIVLVFGGLGLANALKPSPGQSEEATLVQAKLDALPMTIGDWKAEASTIPPKQLVVAEAQAHLSRIYTNAKSRSSINVMLLYGEPGPLGAHTPETCYAGAGFKQLGTPSVKSVAGRSADYWSGNFETGGDVTSTVNVNWTWGTDGVWKASDNPRFDFAGQTAIFKLYITRTLPRKDSETNPVEEFLPEFLKQLQGQLKPAA